MPAFLKLIGQAIANYFKTKLADKVKDAFLKGLKAFKDVVWNELKEEVHECAQDVIKCVDEYVKTDDAKAKEEAAVEAIMAKIKLPLVLRPFRGIIKNLIKSKIEKLVTEKLKEVRGIVG